MKRQDILEIIVSNPQAIFKNSNRDAGKYSEYATYFQVTGVSQDKSSVFTKSVSVTTKDYLVDDKGEWCRDEDNRVIPDTRPIAERTVIGYGMTRLIPTRLVLKTDMTEASMLAVHIIEEEARAKEMKDRETAVASGEADAIELQEVLTALNIINLNTSHGERPSVDYWGRATLQFKGESLTRLVSALKSVVTETKCKHCDATDSYNFGQCISCDEQQEVGV